MSDLTEQQREFVAHYVANGGNGAEAARQAGYAEKSARTSAYKLLCLPHIQAAVRAEQRRALAGVASIAIAQARALLEDPNTPAGARVTLISAVLDRGGLTPVKAADPGDSSGDVDLRSLSLEELEERVRRMEARRAANDARTAADDEAEPVTAVKAA